MPSAETISASKRAQELRETWQARALVSTQRQHIGVVLLSILADAFDDALPVLLRVVFPGFTSIAPEFLCSSGKIDKSGRIVADVVNHDGTISKDVVIYKSETALRDDFRRLADRLKLSATERIEMFMCVQRWVVADRRLDPTMDPRDPDARRLVH